ncbi:conserved hypothetical protein [Lodderomyces elongisporus NRRL YB-4239]|uniref:Uncharacterized protein n=1 Tax=Lodderomyces elongisporus (strain ATCC 11503 / CBS 2605 / JCM 1781 / NBRC 1676 / NRRL YB-4239) TaxID=379508 RepID=A5DUC0_LODEL|nr:conserved hypothetical protein [Lodderomyces elongisporus NRRL YB-4239]
MVMLLFCFFKKWKIKITKKKKKKKHKRNSHCLILLSKLSKKKSWHNYFIVLYFFFLLLLLFNSIQFLFRSIDCLLDRLLILTQQIDQEAMLASKSKIKNQKKKRKKRKEKTFPLSSCLSCFVGNSHVNFIEWRTLDLQLFFSSFLYSFFSVSSSFRNFAKLRAKNKGPLKVVAS